MRSLLCVLFVLSLCAVSARADNYTLDAAHSTVGFKVKHLVISTVPGRFNKFKGTFAFDDKKNSFSNINVEIESASIDTNEPDRDKHLRTAEFFDVEKHPKITFVGENVTLAKAKKGKLKGKLQIRGTTKEVVFNFEPQGTVTDPWGNERVGFTAETTINRKDYGVSWNKTLDKGGVMVNDEVVISIDGEAIKDPPPKASTDKPAPAPAPSPAKK